MKMCAQVEEDKRIRRDLATLALALALAGPQRTGNRLSRSKQAFEINAVERAKAEAERRHRSR